MEAATLTTVLLRLALSHARRASRPRGNTSFSAASASRRRCSGRSCSTSPREKLLGGGGGALLWTELDDVKSQLEPTVLSIAFVFLLVGYGTKVGLVPLHNWLPDAHAEGPTPVSAVLSGLLPQRRALRGRPLQGAGRGVAATRRFARGSDAGLRPAVGGCGRAVALAAEGREAAVRLFVDRAHGNHDVRVRHGRSGRQFRGAAAHDRPLAHQVARSSLRSATRRRRAARRSWTTFAGS